MGVLLCTRLDVVGEPAPHLPPQVGRRLSARYGLRVTLLVVAVSLVAVPFAALLFEVLRSGRLTRWDASVAEALNRRVV